MNEHVRQSFPRPATQGAEGLPRWRWTVDDLDRMVGVGLLHETDRVELIEGEIVPMSPKGARHEDVRDELSDWLSLNLPKHSKVSTELGWRPRTDAYHEPDLLIYKRGRRPGSRLPPADVLLLIEVADSSLGYDLGTKARQYAGLGVREYWVVEAGSLVTHVHLEPSPSGYGRMVPVPATTALIPTLLPDMSLQLAALQLE